MFFHSYITSLHQSLASLVITDTDGAELPLEAGFDQLSGMSRKIQELGRTQFLCGNGASAAFANHMALDWTKNGGVPTHSFSDSALLTAMGNDLGYDQVFAAPLGWYACANDLLLTISSSGNSPNILTVIAKARALELRVVTFSGLKPDNKSRTLGDLNFYIPGKTYGIVECAHQVLLHIWLDHFMGITEWDRETVQNMRSEAFQI